MADVFQEVDEMMKQERLERFWKENGVWVITFIVLTIVMTGAITFYKSWNKGVQERQTAALINILDAPDFPEGVETKIAEFRAPLRAIALLSAAEKRMSNDETNEALSFYQKVVDDSGVPQEFRDMAVFMNAQLNENLDVSEKLSMFETIYSKANSPWRYHAYLKAALLQAHQNEDYKAARQLLANISAAEAVPTSLKENALKLDHVYRAKLDIKEQTEESGS